MSLAGRPRWQQFTALVSLTTGGAVTGFSFAPGAVGDITTPTSMPIRLMALAKSARPAASDDAMLRSAIVNVASYYLRMAESKTPAEMEQIIWQHDSLDGVDHGPSCAAFASLTLELGAQVMGQQSWVTGGASYPWPLHTWADVRVDPNPDSMGITSVLQDAQANGRWHALGDGYDPQPGDWVLFDGHVEVVTKYAGGSLYTIGGDSGPNLSVNAHEYAGPLAAQGVVGFVNNGELAAASQPAGSGGASPGSGGASPAAESGSAGPQAAVRATAGLAAIPGVSPAPGGSAVPGAADASGQSALPAAPAAAPPHPHPHPHRHPKARRPRPARRGASRAARRADVARPGPRNDAAVPGTGPSWPAASSPGTARGAASIPGLPVAAHRRAARSRIPSPTSFSRPRQPAAAAPPMDTSAQQAFISQVAPGAVAAQRKYGVPAAVTIAQAIEESGWGQSGLAVRDHNLFGMKGTGPAGSDALPTEEFENGQMIPTTALFRVYNDVAESIDDHGKLLATSGYYRQSMADRHDPNRFATSLTGVYATDPDYGSKLIGLMQQYDLYRYDAGGPAGVHRPPAPAGAAIPGVPTTAPAPPARTPQPEPDPQPSQPTATPQPSQPAPAPQPSRPAPAPQPSRPAPAPQPSQPAPNPQPSQSTPAPQPSQATPDPQPSQPAPTSPPAPAAPTSQPAQARATSQAVGAVPMQRSRATPTAARSRATPRPSRLAGPPRPARRSAPHLHQHHLPLPVRNAFVAAARGPIMRAEPLYRDVARHRAIRWELLAACDWMQCEAQPRYSPVDGQKLGPIHRTKSQALEQCADELIKVASDVYQIDLTAQPYLCVPDLAEVFAAFRWGELLKLHRTSAMEFPYSVAGLSDQHFSMRWPNIDEPKAPDKPGSRFRRPFGAVPVMLALQYPAMA